MWWEVRVQLLSFASGYSVFIASFVENLSFSHWMALGTPFLKINDHICEGLFLDSLFYSVGPYVYPMPMPHSFDYSIVSFEIRNWVLQISSYSRLFCLSSIVILNIKYTSFFFNYVNYIKYINMVFFSYFLTDHFSLKVFFI